MIAIASRRSLLVIAAIAAIAGISWWLSPSHSGPPPGESLESPAPRATAGSSEIPVPDLPFTDVTAASGVDFVHRNGARGDKLLPETMGGGVAFFDYDADGDPDLLFTSSTSWPEHRASPEPASLGLFVNRGDGTFEDRTIEAGLDVVLYAMGTVVGDYDGDGDPDLYVTALGRNLLLRNDGGRFFDVTEAAGVAGQPDAWSSGAAFADLDGDQDLDLFVCNYVRWSAQIDATLDFRLDGIGKAYGPPQNYAGTLPYLFRNNGDGTFTEAGEESGVNILSATGEPMAKALAVLPTDVDGDGLVDLLIANDTVRNFFFHNLGDGRFEEVGELYGLAYDRNGQATGAMGVDAARYRNDANLAFAVGNFANEMSSIYVSQDDPTFFVDEAIPEGLGAASRRQLTFGLLFQDFDLDGRQDLLQVNGHIEDGIAAVDASQSFLQPAQILWNAGAEGFIEAVSIDDLARPMAGRGVASADIDADGDLDLAIAQNGAPAILMRNDQALGFHWIALRLQGLAPNTAAYGAQAAVRAGGLLQRVEVRPTRSYLAQVEPRIIVGLGLAQTVEEVLIRWPDGRLSTLKALSADREYIVLHPDLK